MKLIISNRSGNTSAEGPQKKNKTAGKHIMRDKPADERSVQLYRRPDSSTHVERESNVDTEKVNAIKAAISAGTYLVDADTIASKLMELEIELTRQDDD